MGIGVDTGRVRICPVDSVVSDVADGAANVQSTSAKGDIERASHRDFLVVTRDDDNVVAVMVQVSHELLSFVIFLKAIVKVTTYVFFVFSLKSGLLPHINAIS